MNNEKIGEIIHSISNEFNLPPNLFHRCLLLPTGCVEIQLRKIGKLPYQSQYQAQRTKLKIMLLNLKSSINYSLNMDGVCCSNNV